MKKLVTSSDLTMVRSNVEHICFVDIDSVPSFFKKCDDIFNTVPARRIIPPGVFVWCFCSRASNVSAVIGNHTSFYSLLMTQRVEVDYTPATCRDASSIALAKCVGQVHADILLAIPFTIISSESAFSEVAPLLRDRDVLHVQPTSQHWPEVLANRLRSSDLPSPATMVESLHEFSHIAPADRNAFRFATMALNLPDHETWFITWDIMAEIKSHMDAPFFNYVILMEPASDDTWVPLRTTDFQKEIRAICAASPNSRIHLVLSDLGETKKIPHDFLRSCSQLVSVNMSGLTAVTSIGGSFCYGCSSLTSVNMSGLTAVTSIGGTFCYRCSSLTSVNMSGLTAVTSIGDTFCYQCSSLTSVNMSGLTFRTNIGSPFCYECSSLTSLEPWHPWTQRHLSAATVLAINNKFLQAAGKKEGHKKRDCCLS